MPQPTVTCGESSQQHQTQGRDIRQTEERQTKRQNADRKRKRDARAAQSVEQKSKERHLALNRMRKNRSTKSTEQQERDLQSHRLRMKNIRVQRKNRASNSKYKKVWAKYNQEIYDRQRLSAERIMEMTLLFKKTQSDKLTGSKDPETIYWHQILQPWYWCDCCNVRRPKCALYPAKSTNNLESWHGLPNAENVVYYLCHACSKFKPKNDTPVCPRSACKNQLAVPKPPPNILNLSYMELQAIRLIHPFQTILTLPSGQQGAKGQVINIPADPTTMTRSLLPHPPNNNGIVAVRQEYNKEKARQKNASDYSADTYYNTVSTKYTKSYSVSPTKVYHALQWLKLNNKLYSTIEVLPFADIQNIYPDNFSENVTHIDNWDSFGCFDIDGEMNVNDIPEDCILPAYAPSRIYPTSTGPPTSNRNTGVEEKAYPNLFPTGEFGEMHPNRPSKLTRREYYQIRLSSFDCRWQADPSYIFGALSNILKDVMYSSIRFIMRQSHTRQTLRIQRNLPAPPSCTQVNRITAGHLLQQYNTNNTISNEDSPSIFNVEPARYDSASYIMNNLCPTVLSNIRGSSWYFRKCGRHLHAMVSNLGPPIAFLTFSLSEEHPELYIAIDPKRFPDENSTKSLSPEERAAFLNAHPVDAAQFYQVRLKAIIRYLCSDAKPLGERVTDYFVKTEKQRKGQLHAHLCVWVENQPNISTPEGRARVVELAKQAISAEMPDKDSNPQLHDLVKRHQVHIHTFTCQKGNSSKKSHIKHKNNMKSRLKSFNQQSNPANSQSSSKIHDLLIQEDDSDTDSNSDSSEDEIDFHALNVNTVNSTIYNNYKKHAIRQKCRFGFPHDRCDSTHIRTEAESHFLVKGDREIMIKRTTENSEWINNYNPTLLPLIKSNMDIQFLLDHFAAVAYLISYVTKGEKDERAIIANALGNMNENSTTSDILARIGNAVISFREVSKQEAGLIITGEPIYFSSRTTTYIDTRLPDKRTRCIKRRADLELLTNDSEDIFVSNVHDRYQIRPTGKHWDDMTLLEFAQWFETTRESVCNSGVDNTSPSENQDMNLNSSDIEEDVGFVAGLPNPLWRKQLNQPPFTGPAKNKKQPRFTLANNSRIVIRQRCKQRCLSTTYFQLETLESVYSTLLLHTPFRNEMQDLINENPLTFDGVVHAFHTHYPTITLLSQCNYSQFAEQVKRVTEYIDSLSSEKRDACLNPIFNHDPYTFNQSTSYIAPDPNILDVNEQTSQCNVSDDNVNEANIRRQWTLFPSNTCDGESNKSLEDQLTKNMSSLTQEQHKVLGIIRKYLDDYRKFDHDTIKWHRIQKANLLLPSRADDFDMSPPLPPKPPRLFISGPGGVGKSFLINTIKLLVQVWSKRDPHLPRENGGVLVCAPTGVASYNISATTIHSLFRIPVEKSGRSKFAPLHGFRLEEARHKMRGLVLLIIDEVSMVSAQLLYYIHHRLNQILNHTSSPGVYFGNIAILLVGDFAQLSPVAAKTIFDTNTCGIFEGFNLYRNLFQPILLSTPVRQAGDLSWSHYLNNEIRWGHPQMSNCAKSLLESRVECNLSPAEISTFDNATRLFPTNSLCDSYNNIKINQLARKLKSSPLTILAHDILLDKDGQEIRSTQLTRKKLFHYAGNNPNNTGSLLQEIKILPGAEVMLRYNVSVKNGLTNGARGTVFAIKFPNLPLGQVPEATNSQGPDTQMPESIYIKFHNVNVGGDLIETHIDQSTNLPVKVVQIKPQTVEFPAANRDSFFIKRTQIPIILAYAITVHKSQSLTLSKVVIDLSNPNLVKPGMAYVALSRVRSINDIMIMLGYDENCIRCSASVDAEYHRLERICGYPTHRKSN